MHLHSFLCTPWRRGRFPCSRPPIHRHRRRRLTGALLKQGAVPANSWNLHRACNPRIILWVIAVTARALKRYPLRRQPFAVTLETFVQVRNEEVLAGLRVTDRVARETGRIAGLVLLHGVLPMTEMHMLKVVEGQPDGTHLVAIEDIRCMSVIHLMTARTAAL